MNKHGQIRIYDLAKELKQNPFRIIEDSRHEGANVRIPSHSISNEMANKIRVKYSSKKDSSSNRGIRIFKKSTNKVINITSSTAEELSTEKPKSEKEKRICEFCAVSVLAKKYEKHVSMKCPKRPSLLQGDLEELNESFLKVEEILWEFFPKGDWFTGKENNGKISEYIDHLRNKGKWDNNFFDQSRLTNIEKKLSPCQCFIGKEKFEGYVVYLFNWTDRIILECPIYGNATYIIKPGKYSWKQIAKESKLEARTKYFKQIVVINHNETWFDRLRQNL